MTPRELIAAFETLAEAPDGVKRLRELVLQLAVRGKLVPQDPRELSVEIFRPTGQRKQFHDWQFPDQQIPTGWKCVRLEDVASLRSTAGKSIKTSEIQEHGLYPVVDQGQAFIRGYCDLPEHLVKISSPVVLFGDHTRNVKLVNFDFIPGAEGVCLIEPKSNITSSFLFLHAQAAEVPSRGYGRHFRLLQAIPVLLPPLSEQHRIVAQVDELMGLLDRLETARTARDEVRRAARAAALAALRDAEDTAAVDAAWARLSEQMDALLHEPEDVAPLRGTILEFAVRGKLVRQDPDDEPCEIPIRMHPPRNLSQASPVDAGSSPFDVPNGWTWCRLGDLGSTQTGSTPEKSFIGQPGPTVPFVRPNDIHWCGVDTRREEVPRVAAESTGRIAAAGSVYMVCIGGSIGKTARCSVEATFNQQINVITPEVAEGSYVAWAMRAPFFQAACLASASATAIPILNKGRWEALPLPVPPRAEQRRIVARIDALMALCDQLEARLTAARELQAQFAAAAVYHLDV